MFEDFPIYSDGTKPGTLQGFVGPIGSDVKDIMQQLTGGRDLGQYLGWSQLGQNKTGGNLTLVDALAATRQDVAALDKKLDRLIDKVGK